MKHLLFCIILLVTMNTLKAQNGPQDNRFKKANLKLETRQANENRVVFMGNSITEGWSQDSLSLFKNKNYINRGIGGQTTAQMKLRFKQDVIDLNPKAVVILAGINDIAQNAGFIPIPAIASNIQEMTLMAKAHNIKVVICSVLPANCFPWRQNIHPADMVIELNVLLKEIARNNNVVYLDYYSAMVDDKKGMKEAYTTDGVHCTIEGYRTMEPIIEGCLKRLF